MCFGCSPNERERQQKLLKKEKEAEKHAQKIKKLVAIYYDERDQPAFMEAEQAKAENIQPIQFVPYVPGTDNG